MNKNIILCGVGGQGTVLASKLIADAAMKKGLFVLSAETIGMAQRGGSVVSHLRVGEDLYSPMVAAGSADLILGFEPGETVRMLPYLKEGGQVIVSAKPIMPITAALTEASYQGEDMIAYLKNQIPGLVIVDTEKAIKDLGSPKALNILLLGAAVESGALGLSEEEIKGAIQARLPVKLHEINFRALSYYKNQAERS